MSDTTALSKSMAAVAAVAQRAADSIVQAFKQAQLDPGRAAEIKRLAAGIRAIRDRNHG